MCTPPRKFPKICHSGGAHFDFMMNWLNTDPCDFIIKWYYSIYNICSVFLITLSLLLLRWLQSSLSLLLLHRLQSSLSLLLLHVIIVFVVTIITLWLISCFCCSWWCRQKRTDHTTYTKPVRKILTPYLKPCDNKCVYLEISYISMITSNNYHDKSKTFIFLILFFLIIVIFVSY